MAWWRNLRMVPKLVSSFVLVALLTALVGGAGFLGLQSQDAQLNHLTTVSVPNMLAILQTQRDLNASIRYAHGAILAPSAADSIMLADSAASARAQTLQDWQTQSARANTATDNTTATALTDGRETALTTPLNAGLTTLQARYQQHLNAAVSRTRAS